MVRQDKTIAYLDGIRGVAALGVFLNHFSLAFYPAWNTLKPELSHLDGLEIAYTHSILSFLNSGTFYVSVFFVLSGYVLSHKYFSSNDVEALISGLFRRFLRLFMPITFVIILSYILLMSHLYFNDPVSQISMSNWFSNLWHIGNPTRLLFENILYGSSLFVGVASFDTCLWTMSWEFYGSLFVFTFLLFTHFTKRFQLPMLLLPMVYFFIMKQPLYEDMLLGMTLFYIEQKVKNSGGIVTNLLAIVLLPLSLALASVPFVGPLPGTWQEAVKNNIWDYTPWCAGVTAYFLVVVFVLSPFLQRIANLKPLAFLGYISFSLYLLHPILIGSFGSWLFLKVYDGSNYNESVLISFVAMIPVLIVCSWLMAKYVDQFGIRFAKKVYGIVRNATP